ncbi:MAG: hypothetical protein ACLQT6_03150 [Desulfomonilaceae bacterium]
MAVQLDLFPIPFSVFTVEDRSQTVEPSALLSWTPFCPWPLEALKGHTKPYPYVAYNDVNSLGTVLEKMPI